MYILEYNEPYPHLATSNNKMAEILVGLREAVQDSLAVTWTQNIIIY